MANRANRENREPAVGNTNAGSKQGIQTKHWCFTLNNWTVEELEQIEQIVQQCCDKWIIGKEVHVSSSEFQDLAQMAKMAKA